MMGKATTTERGYGWEYQRLRPIVLDRDHHRCQVQLPCCTGKATAVDHIIPGGPNDLTNLRAACVPCNNARRRLPGRRPVATTGPSPALASASVTW